MRTFHQPVLFIVPLRSFLVEIEFTDPGSPSESHSLVYRHEQQHRRRKRSVRSRRLPDPSWSLPSRTTRSQFRPPACSRSNPFGLDVTMSGASMAAKCTCPSQGNHCLKISVARCTTHSCQIRIHSVTFDTTKPKSSRRLVTNGW